MPLQESDVTVNDPFKTRVRVRMAETGENYMTAVRALRAADAVERPPSAQRLQDDLAAAFRAAGWPVEVEHNPLAAGLRLYAGPATVSVDRAEPPHLGLSGDEHPDDPDVFDLDSPLTVTLWAPLITEPVEHLARIGGIDGRVLPAGLTVSQTVAQVDAAVAAARARDLADTPADTQCAICGDPHHRDTLFGPTASPQLVVCPCCVFDGDLMGELFPDQLALDLDTAWQRDLALTAGWAAVAVLLTCLAGPGFGDRLDQVWQANHVYFEPNAHWHDPSTTWVWLPPVTTRPAALAGLGCGAALGSVMAALDHAHPDLRTLYRQREHDDLELDDTEDDDGSRVPEHILDRMWPAVVAYSVALTTQQRERPGQRVPWHVLASFEAIPYWLNELEVELDDFHVQTALGVGIRLLTDLFGEAA